MHGYTPLRCSTLFMVVVENQLIRLVVLAMVETIERMADEYSSALAWHAAIIMKSLINPVVEVVIHCSTHGIDYAQQLVGLGTLTLQSSYMPYALPKRIGFTFVVARGLAGAGLGS